MSSVRMCDRCGQVFSERAEGWSSQEGTIMRKNQETGRMEQVHAQIDLCPEDTELAMTPAPRPMLTSRDVQAQYGDTIPGTVETP